MLILTTIQLAAIADQAQQCYPEECCGLLLGQGKTVQQVWSTVNCWTPDFAVQMQGLVPTASDQSRRNRFAIAPEQILQAQKYARHHQQAIIGIYHSHPDYPAVPSEYDRCIAWEIYSYLILTVTDQGVTSLHSWVLDGDRQFQPEPIQTIQS